MTKKPPDPVHCWLVWRKAHEVAFDYPYRGIEETAFPAQISAFLSACHPCREIWARSRRATAIAREIGGWSARLWRGAGSAQPPYRKDIKDIEVRRSLGAGLEDRAPQAGPFGGEATSLGDLGALPGVVLKL
jgi:hypothetical protein